MSQNAPPRPSGLPIVGHTFKWANDAFEFRERIAAEHGGVVQIDIAGVTMYMVSDPEYIEQVLVSEHQKYVKPELFKSRLRAVYGNGILVSEGDFWKGQREFLQPAFNPRAIKSYADTMVDCVREHVTDWTDGTTLNAYREMSGLTLRVLVRSLFDADLDYEETGIEESLDTIYQKFDPAKQPVYIPTWIPTPTNVRYRRGVENLNEVIRSMIDDRLASDSDGDDLLSKMTRDLTSDDGILTRKSLRDELMNLLLAGHETSALTLTFAWFLLGEHPEVMEKLRDELDAVLGGRPPTAADLPELTYTEQVVKETMRVYPPVHSIAREATTDVEIGPYHLSEGSIVDLNPWVVHRSERWYDDPHEFQPERWDGDLEERLPRFAYFPFGGGPRQCIGNHFTMIEAQLAMATMAQEFDVVFSADGPLELQAAITAQPKTPMEATIRER